MYFYDVNQRLQYFISFGLQSDKEIFYFLCTVRLFAFRPCLKQIKIQLRFSCQFFYLFFSIYQSIHLPILKFNAKILFTLRFSQFKLHFAHLHKICWMLQAVFVHNSFELNTLSSGVRECYFCRASEFKSLFAQRLGYKYIYGWPVTSRIEDKPNTRVYIFLASSEQQKPDYPAKCLIIRKSCFDWTVLPNNRLK